jgi:WD40 repeat protein
VMSASFGTVIVWEVVSNKVEKIVVGSLGPIRAIAFSPDNKKILFGGDYGVTLLWNLAERKVEKKFITNGYISAVAFSPDDKKILTGNYSGMTLLWDVATEKVEKYFINNTEYVNAVAFSPDSKNVLISHKNETTLWNIATNKLKKSFIDTHSWDITAMAYSPDKKNIVTYSSSNNGMITLWAGISEKAEKSFTEQEQGVFTVAFSPDGKIIVTTEEFGSIQLYNSENRQVLKTLKGHNGRISALAFSLDGKKLITGSMDNTAKIWDVASGQLEQSLLWDVETEEAKKTYNRMRKRLSVPAVAFSPDGKTVLTSCGDNTAKLWNSQNGQVLKTFVGHTQHVNNVAFAPNGKQVFTISKDSTAKLWDIQSGKAIKTFNARNGIASSNGKKLLTVSSEKNLELWDLVSGKIEKTFIGHTQLINDFAFSPDGKKIVTGSSDKTIKLWDVASAQAEKTFIGHTGAVNSVAFSPDGKKIISGSSDKTAKLWDIETNALEDRVYAFSLYEMAQAGLIIEPADTPQYIRDSTAYAEQIKQYEQFQNPLINVADFDFNAPIRKSTDYKNRELLIDSLINNVKAKQRAEQEAVEKQAAIEKEKTNPVGSLNDKVDKENDPLKKYNLYKILIDTLTKRWQQTPEEYGTELASAYINRAESGFKIEKFKESEQDLRAGIKADSTNKFLYTNLALALLFQGKLKQAQAEYEKWKDKTFDPNNDLSNYREAFLSDLNSYEASELIPKERIEDVKTIRKLLEKKE